MSVRIAGLFLLVGCMVMLVTTVDYVQSVAEFTGGEDATVAEKLRYTQSVFERRAFGWMFEVMAVALIATASLTLSSRSSRIGWILAGVGALFTAPMYALLRGGTGAVLKNTEINAELYAGINGIAAETFFIGQGLMMSGLGLAFILEFFSEFRPLPRWFLAIGGLFSTVSGLVFILVHTNLVESYMIAGLTGLVGLAASSMLGGAFVLGRGDQGCD